MEQVSGYDLSKLIQEAKVRWLKPIEVLFILQNHEYIGFTNKPPLKPPSGLLYLYNKRVNRYFRNDGHSWKKKKGSKNLDEGHEKLKVENREVLQCYYTHGHEIENPHLRRRIYWMLDPAYEHVVLVHYREVPDEKFNPGRTLNFSNGSPYSTPIKSSEITNPGQTSSLSPASTEEVCSQLLTPDSFNNIMLTPTGENLNNFNNNGLSTATTGEDLNNFNNIMLTPTGENLNNFNNNGLSTATTGEDLNNFNNIMLTPTGENLNNFNNNGLSTATTGEDQDNFNSSGLTTTTTGEDEDLEDWVASYERVDEMRLSADFEANKKDKEEGCDLADLFEGLDEARFEVKEVSDDGGHTDGCAENHYTIEMLRNSAGWWMEELQLEESIRQNDSSLLVQNKPMCTIREICPDWAFAHEKTKVIITGDFPINPSELFAQFGENQVALELVQEGVFKCWAPLVSAQTVNLHIIDHTGEIRSESHEFTFRQNPNSIPTSNSNPNSNADERDLLVKLVNKLLGDEKTENLGNLSNNLEDLVEELVKDKLENWVLNQRVENENGDFVLPKKDHGIIHLIAGLGYKWALNMLLDLGVNVNFRDKNGWTALHWAARFGREEMVISLILAGASVSAVSDPTCQTEGRTAGFIADLYNHKGIAAYLSEAKLTSHPLASDQLTNQKALHSIHSRKAHTVGTTEDQLSLKDCLEGGRNALQAATRIQQAFRSYSFKVKREKMRRYERENSSYLLSREEMSEIGSRVSDKAANGSRVSDKAAVSIQKNFRCWKKRKEFVTLRRNAVKIQTHYRAHQARKYKNFLSTVSILEKVILRWHKKGVGLRGYQPDPLRIDTEDESDIIEAFRKQKVEKELNETVSRVLNVVDAPEARQQYRRMLAGYQLAKSGLEQQES
ncbi:hypothetical protein LUZ60_002061 [Juncus effusus]|nr:hypothetical protein LUZ60_002061 [Juncus effusus]